MIEEASKGINVLSHQTVTIYIGLDLSDRTMHFQALSDGTCHSVTVIFSKLLKKKYQSPETFTGHNGLQLQKCKRCGFRGWVGGSRVVRRFWVNFQCRGVIRI